MTRAVFEAMHAQCETRREVFDDNTALIACREHRMRFVYTRRTPVAIIPDNAIIFKGTYATTAIIPRDGKALTKKGPWR